MALIVRVELEVELITGRCWRQDEWVVFRDRRPNEYPALQTAEQSFSW